MKQLTELHEPYRDTDRQAEAAMMGIYVIIGTEIMLFGGLFLTIAWLRCEHPEEVVQASKAMHWWLAGINTAVLLSSSAAVALAIEYAKQGRVSAVTCWLLIGLAFGVAFLVLKAHEYSVEYEEGLLPVSGSGEALVDPSHRLFMNIYVISTGLHAVHLTLGILLLAGLLVGVLSKRLVVPQHAIVIVVSGVYWHFVDVVWIFLYPLLYLAR